MRSKSTNQRRDNIESSFTNSEVRFGRVKSLRNKFAQNINDNNLKNIPVK